jgi:exonuclease SbcD
VIRLLHTADLHIEDRTYGFDRAQDHAALFTAIAKDVAELEVDLVIMAGDIFDNRSPSAESLSIFTHGLDEIRRARPDVWVVVSSGNHDGSPVIGDAKAKVTGWLKALRSPRLLAFSTPMVQTIPIRGAAVSIASLPYAHKRSLDLGPMPAQDRLEATSRAVENVIEQLRVPDLKEGQSEHVKVFVGHISVLGTMLSADSALKIGWDLAIRPEVFERFDYAALGHIHKHQRVTDTVVYSGSPMATRFGEIEKGWVIVDLDPMEAKPGVSFRLYHGSPVYLDAAISFVEGQAGSWRWESDTLVPAQVDYLRLRISGSPPRREVDRLLADLSQRARGLVVEHIQPPKPERVRASAIEPTRSPSDALDAWLTEWTAKETMVYGDIPLETYREAGQAVLEGQPWSLSRPSRS